MMMATRPPPSPSRRASAAAVLLPSGPPPPSRRRSSMVPRRASNAAAPTASTESSSNRHQHYADIPLLDSDNEGSVGSEQLAALLPPPPRSLSRRASTVAVLRTGGTPREDDTAAAAPPPPSGGFANYAFPVEQATAPPPSSVAASRADQKQRMQRAASAVVLNPQSYSSSTFYDPTIAAHASQQQQRGRASPPSQQPQYQQPPPTVFTAPAPAPQLQPPPPSQGSGPLQQSNPLRNPHAKVSGVEIHAPLPRLQATTEHAADRTRDAVYKFMEQLCPERAAAVQNVMDQFSGRETLLMEAITSIFGDEWASHRRQQGSLLAIQAAKDDVKAIMPVALRHQPKIVHTTEDVLDGSSPLRVDQKHSLRIEPPQMVGQGSTAPFPDVPTQQPVYAAPPLAASGSYTDVSSTPRDYLPPSSSRVRPPFSAIPSGASPRTADDAYQQPLQHPAGINNSRPGTPMLSVQRSVSAPAPPQDAQYDYGSTAFHLPAGRRTASPPGELSSALLTATDGALTLSTSSALPLVSDPVMMVMATPSNGGILTPPLPQELVYQPYAHGTTHWRR